MSEDEGLSRVARAGCPEDGRTEDGRPSDPKERAGARDEASGKGDPDVLAPLEDRFPLRTSGFSGSMLNLAVNAHEGNSEVALPSFRESILPFLNLVLLKIMLFFLVP